MNQALVYFLLGTLLLPALLVALHALRTRITLGPFFGVTGVYSLMLWQLLQTGWWVSYENLHFNTALAIFIPALILGLLLIFALDGLRTARAYVLMVLTTSAGAWLFSVFRESLAQQVPLPYLIVISNREHLAIICGLLLAQMAGMMVYTLVKVRLSWFALPLSHAAGVLLWLVSYSLIEFDFAMGLANLGNEWPTFLLSTLPSLLLLAGYGLIAHRRGLFMPVRAWRHLYSFWRATQSDASGELGGDVIVNRDQVVSELRLLNRQLADSASVMETHMREAVYGIVIADEKGRIRQTNRPACDLLKTPLLDGFYIQTVLGRRIRNIASLDELVATKEGQRFLASEGNDERWLEIQTTRLKGEGLNGGYYLIIKDVTAAVSNERHQLVSSRVRDLYQTGRVLAHDFSNLLIGAQAHLAQLKGSAGSGENEVSLLAVESALQRAREMLQQLGSGTQFGVPRLSHLDLAHLVDESVAIVRAAAQSAGITIDLVSTAAFRVEADASQMIRVLTNLLRNAIRASVSGGRIVVTLRPANRGAEICIADRGCGMTQKQLEMAFDPGFSTKDGGQGGLGLAISYLITEAHGGRLELRTNGPGGGVSAIVWLPAASVSLADKAAYDDLLGLSVILAMPPSEQAARVASELAQNGCLQVAEVYTPEELYALVHEDSGWQVVLVSADFSFDQLEGALPDSLRVRFLQASPS